MSDAQIVPLSSGSSSSFPARTRRVVFVLLPEVNLLDLAGPAQVFHAAAALGAPYTLAFCAAQADVASAQGLMLAQLTPLPAVDAGDVVIVPGLNLRPYATGAMNLAPAVSRWLVDATQAGAYLASVCTGAFVLGEAGLLDHRRCTTHWSAIDALRTRYPRAQVRDAVLFVHDRHITTSAGIAAGIDMALSLVEQDQGPLLVAQVARQLVVYLRRDGTQPQTSVYLQYRTHLHPGVHRVQDYLLNHLDVPVSLDDLAAVAQMSGRSLGRAFRDATGLTPIQYQQRLRLELAATLLHNPDLSIDAVAAKAGFADARHFRRLWNRQYGAPPSVRRT